MPSLATATSQSLDQESSVASPGAQAYRSLTRLPCRCSQGLQPTRVSPRVVPSPAPSALESRSSSSLIISLHKFVLDHIHLSMEPNMTQEYASPTWAQREKEQKKERNSQTLCILNDALTRLCSLLYKERAGIAQEHEHQETWVMGHHLRNSVEKLAFCLSMIHILPSTKYFKKSEVSPHHSIRVQIILT